MKKFYATTNREVTSMEAAHYEMGRQIASAGMVLLENNGILPLNKGQKCCFKKCRRGRRP